MIVPGQPITPEGGEPRRMPAQGRTCVLWHHCVKASSLSVAYKAEWACLPGLVLCLRPWSYNPVSKPCRWRAVAVGGDDGEGEGAVG